MVVVVVVVAVVVDLPVMENRLTQKKCNNGTCIYMT